jgi:tRNA A37 threonylcarbamoyladenosine synthetase subunit TsaC/SUA5/YrdC
VTLLSPTRSIKMDKNVLGGTNSLEECVLMAASALNEGKVIALPTDTVYGIAALAQSTAAIQKMYEIKGRNFEKPIAISVGNIEDVHKQVYLCIVASLWKTNRVRMESEVVPGWRICTILMFS